MTDEPIEASELIRQLMLHELSGRSGASMWPAGSIDIPDDSMIFRVAYLGLEWATVPPDEIQRRLDDLHRHHGQTRRQFRNGLAFALPDVDGLQSALASSTDVLVEADWDIVRAIGQAQLQGKHPDSLHGKLYALYRNLYLPGEGQAYLGETQFVVIPMDLDHTENNLHDGVLKRLDPYFRNHLSPDELAWTIGLGKKDCAGFLRMLFPLADVARWFFIFLNLPRLHGVETIQKAVAEGIESGEFGLLRTPSLLELDRVPDDARAEVLIRQPISPEEIRFESGAYLVWPGALE